VKTVREAADSLLKKGEITKDEYTFLEKKGAFELTKEALVVSPFMRATAKAKVVSGIAKQWLLPVGLTGAVAIAGKESIVDPLVNVMKTNESFKDMQEKVPQLKDKDQEKIKDYFDVIKTFSPKSASNPLVAGALVNKMMEFGGVDHKLIQDLSSIESGLARPSIAQVATESAAKSVTTLPKGV